MKRLFLLFLILGGFCQHVSGSEPVVYVPVIDPIMSSDGKGPYYQVLSEIVRRSDVSIQIESVPLARAVILFGKNEHSCFFGASKKSAKDYLGKEFIEAEPFNVLKIVLAFAKNDEVRPISELKYQEIAILRGDSVEAFGLEKKHYQFRYLNDHQQSIGMLNSGRVAAIIGGLAELKRYKDQLQIVYEPLYEAYESFACHGSPDLRNLLDKFSKSIREMKVDGTMQRLLGDYYLLD